METIEMTADFEDLAAWVQAQVDMHADVEEYELKPGEFTAEMYMQQSGCSISTAHRHMKILRDAGAIPHKRVKSGGFWIWVYWRPESGRKGD